MTTDDTTTTDAQTRPVTRSKGTRGVAIAAWSIPVLVATQFAMLAIVPVAIVLIRTFRAPSLDRLRWWAVGLTAVYLTPLALWAIGPDRAGSLSKDISPVLAVLVCLAGAAVAVRYHLLKRR